MKKVIAFILTILYATSAPLVFAQDLTSSHFIIRDPVLDSGGGFQSSGSFKMYSAGNLNISGDGGTSASYIGRDGFLQYPEVVSGVLSANASGADINLTWTASTAANGFTISGYQVGISTSIGGPYTYTNVGNVLAYDYINNTPATYYLVVQTLDLFGNVIATSNIVSVIVQGTITFAISDNVVSFGALTAGGPRYATPSGGSSILTPAHTISVGSNSSQGYTILYDGSTLNSGSHTIDPATISGSTTGNPGTNQFALSLLSTGIASVPTTYDQTAANWDFAQNTLATIATTSGPAALETLNVYYLANAQSLAPAGTYNTTVTYEMTANY